METDQERLERLREVGARIASAAAELQGVAEQLRSDVDALTEHQSKQDLRLDRLEAHSDQ